MTLWNAIYLFRLCETDYRRHWFLPYFELRERKVYELLTNELFIFELKMMWITDKSDNLHTSCLQYPLALHAPSIFFFFFILCSQLTCLSLFIEIDNMSLWFREEKKNFPEKPTEKKRCVQFEIMVASFLMSCNFMILTSRKNIPFDDSMQWRRSGAKK